MYTRIKGTIDIFPKEKRLYQFVGNVGRRVAAIYGFKEMSTPIIEHTELFQRSVGDDSDIVSKEMYSFKDLGGSMTCLRPENTAGVVRAVVNEQSAAHMPQRYFYSGPMFRYERPQRGRQRQFEQLGIESFGESDPSSDVEVIDCANMFLNQLSITNDKYTLKINSLGDLESRSKYLNQLELYYKDRRESLSKDSQDRLDRGSILRILDSKDVKDKAISKDAPKLFDYLNSESLDRFNKVLNGLDKFELKYQLDHNLVRGLDYYNHTIFEMVVGDETTTSSAPPLAILGGGRYDGLANKFGYKSQKSAALPSIGWACGVERILMFMDQQLLKPETKPIVVCTFESNESIVQLARDIARTLRHQGYAVIVSDLNLSTSKQIRNANQRYEPEVVIVVGGEEALTNSVQIKHMATESKHTVRIEKITDHLTQLNIQTIDPINNI
ncbi:histidine-tRNA ligase [Heterostelium album PN500]|uniref:histidine--tRNA ligase n=1 Tax=Heterostelium pallidum (strain ATCC 26659 / Pp 5 / PN500) TaxID=670386 RepID=D3BHQ1_HETP5|nr:histidine-tRNA ligase [Heterostelium album PN500]EFA78801.1 histidine-tRNA ligase [Heterostelium album PN500]|eukprot:XP_020430925.1 histidine-tRNA ligase [Heterostelium album PN500]